jgi:hypothetical protein
MPSTYGVPKAASDFGIRNLCIWLALRQSSLNLQCPEGFIAFGMKSQRLRIEIALIRNLLPRVQSCPVPLT